MAISTKQTEQILRQTGCQAIRRPLKFISDDGRTKKTIVSEGIKTKEDDFADIDVGDYDDSWIEKLEVEKGQVVSSIDNIVLILENDPKLKGIYAYNEFDHIEIATSSMPWRKVSVELDKSLRDSDDSNLRHYLERNYKITGKRRSATLLKSWPTVTHSIRLENTLSPVNGTVWKE